MFGKRIINKLVAVGEFAYLEWWQKDFVINKFADYVPDMA